MTFSQARRLAEVWIEIQCGCDVRLMRDAVLAKPYGWVFFYQSIAFLDSGDETSVLVGNAPIIIDRFTSELRVTGTALPLGDYLARYEKELPPARLLASPEQPQW